MISVKGKHDGVHSRSTVRSSKFKHLEFPTLKLDFYRIFFPLRYYEKLSRPFKEFSAGKYIFQTNEFIQGTHGKNGNIVNLYR